MYQRHDKNEWLTVNEAATIIGCSYRNVFYFINNGIVPKEHLKTVKAGAYKRHFVAPEWVERFSAEYKKNGLAKKSHRRNRCGGILTAHGNRRKNGGMPAAV